MTEKKPLIIAALAVLASGITFFNSETYRNRHRPSPRPGFVATAGARFVVDGKTFRFIGANVAVMYKDEDRARMPETLGQASAEGIRVIRVWANGEGGPEDIKPIGGDRADWPRTHPFRTAPNDWNEASFNHLDNVLAEAARDHLHVQLTLCNWWRDTGGVTQYLYWAGIKDAADDHYPFGINEERAMLFYTDETARRLYREHVEKVVTRRNTITGKLYRDDPTIIGYELMNEAQAITERWPERRAWIAEMSAYIKSLDPDHLVSPGTWGYRTAVERREWLKDHSLANVDYCDVHNYPRDDLDSYVDSPGALGEFIDNRAAAAFSLQKPLIIGEFGMGREGYNGSSQLDWYRAYFSATERDFVAGAMFWVLTPDPGRGYGISYATSRDGQIRDEVRRSADVLSSSKVTRPPRFLLDENKFLVPRQFQFTRSSSDQEMQPEISRLEPDSEVYSYRPQSASIARFEKLGGGVGYLWGAGVGWVDYVVPARDKWEQVVGLTVRAHIKPVLPTDALSGVPGTRVALLINNINCGSRLAPVEDEKQAVTEEWQVDSLWLRLQASLGEPLIIKFEVKPDADQPFGVNISNYAAGHNPPGAFPLEVVIRNRARH